MTPLMGDFGEQVLCICVPLGFLWGFPYYIICIYCYARTGYLRSRILSLDIPVFDTPLYIYNHALVILVRYVIDRSVARSSYGFCLPPFSTKAPSYNQLFILLYVLNFCFRGRNTLPSLNYDLSIRLCMVGCYKKTLKNPENPRKPQKPQETLKTLENPKNLKKS